MLEEHVDLVAGDVNGAAWRQSNGNNRQLTSIIEESFADTLFPIPPAPHRCGAQGQCQVNGQTFVGFVKLPDSRDKWKVRKHGAFTILRETLGLRPKDQSCHHEVWLHLDLVGNQYAHESRGKTRAAGPPQRKVLPIPA